MIKANNYSIFPYGIIFTFLTNAAACLPLRKSQPASSKRDIYLSIIRTASSFGQSNRDLSIYLCNQRGLGGEELVLGVHEELHVGPVPRGDDGGGVGVLGGGRAEVVAVADLLVVAVVDGGVGQDAVVVPPAKVLLEAD